MSYQVIARKWRPQVFEEVIGQEAITQTLRNAIEYDRLHHAYLFSGARGVGKTTTARLLAKSLNCRKTDKPNQTPCDTSKDDACVSCQEVAESRSLDVLEFDAASHTKVEEIRDIILESISVNPARDRYKVFIIDEVHMLSKSSFNALLKTLEEPPPNVVFVMATTELHKVPDTILSRCQEFEFRTIALQKILGRLKTIAEAEKIDISEPGLKEIARSGEGSMRDAQSNFDQVISFSDDKIEIEAVLSALGIASADNLTKIIRAVDEKKPEQIFEVVDDLVGRGHDLRNFCRDLLGIFRDLLVTKIVDTQDNLLESAILSAEEMKTLASPFTEADLVRFFNSVAETESKLSGSSEPRYLLEIGLVKLIEMRKVKPIEDILAKIVQLEKALGNQASVQPEKTKTQTASGETSPLTEKKTLISKAPPKDTPFPTDISNFVPDIHETTPVLEKKISIEPTLAAPPKPDPTIKKEPSQEGNESPIALARKSIDINPSRMPVKLAPIEAEELEHVEDKKLDEAYEQRLQKEGDDLKFIRNARKIVSKLISPNEDTLEIDTSKPVVQNDPSPNRIVPKGKNKALEIVSEMTRVEEIDDTIPNIDEYLSDPPTQEELWKYAEDHPLVKRIRRVFRGTIAKVEKTQD